MRRFVVLFAVAAACGGPVEVDRDPCETDADCSGGMICGKNSGRKDSVNPSAPLIAERPAECFEPCDVEITDDCALPACPVEGREIIRPWQFEPDALNPARMTEQCDGLDVRLVLTCDLRSGLVVLTEGSGELASRAWHDGIIGGCDEFTGPLSRWPFTF